MKISYFDLANQCFQPLSHLSKNIIGLRGIWTHSVTVMSSMFYRLNYKSRQGAEYKVYLKLLKIKEINESYKELDELFFFEFSFK